MTWLRLRPQTCKRPLGRSADSPFARDQFKVKRICDGRQGGERWVRAVCAEEPTNGLWCKVGATSEFGFGDAQRLSMLVECQYQPVDLIDSPSRFGVRVCEARLLSALREVSLCSRAGRPGHSMERNT